jgi:hypothetical protein
LENSQVGDFFFCLTRKLSWFLCGSIFRSDKNLTYTLYGQTPKEKATWLKEIRVQQEKGNYLSSMYSIINYHIRNSCNNFFFLFIETINKSASLRNVNEKREVIRSVVNARLVVL